LDDTDADGDAQHLAVRLERLAADSLPNALAQSRYRVVRTVVEDDEERIRDPGDGILDANGFLQALGDDPQHGVTRGVPVEIVHDLETVEIDVGDRARIAHPRAVEEPLERDIQSAPVQHPGKGIMRDKALELGFRLLAGRNVLDRTFDAFG